MNLGGLVERFRTDVDDKAIPYLWSDESVIAWLNDAVDEACQRKRLIFDKTSQQVCHIDVTPGVTVYPLHEAINELVFVSMTPPGDQPIKLGIVDSLYLDENSSDWRIRVNRPSNVIHHDTSLELDAIPDQAYSINLEVYRSPCSKMKVDADKPEIHRLHHLRLLDWVKYCAYSIPDADAMNTDKASISYGMFEEYFGPRPDADQRKDQNSNRPHRVKCWW